MPLPYGRILHPRPSLTNIHHIHYTNTHRLQHSKTKNPLFLTTATTQQTFPHTFTTTDIKTNMHHIRTSIVSRHLTTRGNNKMLRTPPPHSSHLCPNQKKQISLQQIMLTIYTKSTPNYIHHHYAPSATHIRHTPSLQLHPHKHHTVTLGFVDRPRWCDGAAGQMERKAGCWTKSGMIGLPPPPQTSVNGVGRHNNKQHLGLWRRVRKYKVLIKKNSHICLNRYMCSDAFDISWVGNNNHQHILLHSIKNLSKFCSERVI